MHSSCNRSGGKPRRCRGRRTCSRCGEHVVCRAVAPDAGLLDGIEVKSAANDDPIVGLGHRSEQEELAEAVIDVVRAQGRPIPAAQIIQLLPSRFTTSVEQIKRLHVILPV